MRGVMSHRGWRAMVCALPLSVIGFSAQAAEIKLGALVSAQVDSVQVAVGDRVEANQLLIQLDKALFQAKLAQAQAQVDYRQALFAEKESRYKEAKFLYEDTVTARREFEGYQRDYLAAKAQLARAKAELAEWQAREKYYAIRAPQAGQIKAIFVLPGTTVFDENMPLLEMTPGGQ